MSFIIDDPVGAHGNPDWDAWREQWERYREYLASLEGKIPPSAYSFATAEWHYDPQDHRSPHDAWVETLRIEEPASGDRQQVRGLEISVRLLGAYHDGCLELTYKSVRSYSLRHVKGVHFVGAHGDWLVDEVRLSEGGGVMHEIVFASEARWVIEYEAIEWELVPFVN